MRLERLGLSSQLVNFATMRNDFALRGGEDHVNLPLNGGETMRLCNGGRLCWCAWMPRLCASWTVPAGPHLSLQGAIIHQMLWAARSSWRVCAAQWVRKQVGTFAARARLAWTEGPCGRQGRGKSCAKTSVWVGVGAAHPRRVSGASCEIRMASSMELRNQCSNIRKPTAPSWAHHVFVGRQCRPSDVSDHSQFMKDSWKQARVGGVQRGVAMSDDERGLRHCTMRTGRR